MKTLRSRVVAKEVMVGTFCAIPHAMTIEMTAAAGWDFIVIDAEHSQIDRAGLEPLIRAADVAMTPALVRVPDNDRIWIGSALDSGAAGVVVPRVNSARDANAAIAALRYPPLGERGVGPGRASGYGARIPETIGTANDTVVLAIQLETAEGLANIEEIAAVEGVDVIYIGPGDLAVSMGAMGPDGRGALEAAIRKVTDCCKGKGRAVGTFCMTPDHLTGAIRDGLTFVTLASDSMFLGKGIADAADAARRAKSGK